MFRKKTIKDIDISGKRVLVRVDFNVPTDENGLCLDDFKIRASLPTVRYLLKQDCKLVLMSHLDRPNPGEYKPKTSLKNCAEVLSQLLDEEVEFVGDAKSHPSGSAQISLLENLRYYEEEKANDDEFARILASNGEVYVNDAFAVDHRAHASTHAVTRHLPSVAGLLLEKEINNIQKAMGDPKRPVVAIISGLKMETKIPLIKKFISHADTVVIGGGAANTLMLDPRFGGHNVGKSIIDKDHSEDLGEIAELIKAEGTELILPTIDVAIGKDKDDKVRREIPLGDVGDDDMILDYGTESLQPVLERISDAGTIIWNGPLGLIENPNFLLCSQKLAQAIADADGYSVVGGGDTAGFIDRVDLHDKFDHVSTGGGAALELMIGNPLPAVEALTDL